MRVEHDVFTPPGRADGPTDGRVRGPIERVGAEASSLGVLFRELGDDAATLVREEVALAKLELRREARVITSDLVQVGGAVGLVLLGALAMTAFLIVAIGDLLDAYWAGALIVGALLLLGGGLWARSALQSLSEHLQPPQDTMETLQEDARWARHEARAFKREMSR